LKKINEVIVVEGKNDTKKLKSFFDVDTIETHGLGLKKEIIEMIKEINKKRGVILMLDPDNPGEKIRNRLNQEIPNLKNVFLLKEDARTIKKVGVEHASFEVLNDALNNIVTYTDELDSLSYIDFLELGLGNVDNSSYKRDIISKTFKIGKCNAKTMFKRLNMLKINKEEIKRVLDDSQH